MLYLSICKDYKKISAFYIIGMMVTLILSLFLHYVFGVRTDVAMLASLDVGMFLIAVMEYAQFKQYFKENSGNYAGVISYLGRYWQLVVANFLYICGLYCHNFVFWTTDQHLIVVKSFVCMQPYDMATCIGLGAFFPTSDIEIGDTESDNAWEIFGGISSKRKEGGNVHLNGGYRASSNDNTGHDGIFVNAGFDYKANDSFTFIGEINYFDSNHAGKTTDLVLGARYHVKEGMSLTLAAPIALSNDAFFGYDYRLQGMLQYHY